MTASGNYWICPACQTPNTSGTMACRSCGSAAPTAPLESNAQPAPQAPVQTKTYRGDTAEATAQAFTADAAEAAQHGWFPSSQAWEGSNLTVVYQQQPQASAPTSAPAPTQAPPSVAAPSNLGIPASGFGVIIGGVMIVAGSFLPWLTASTGFASIERGGLEGGDGFILAIIGAAVIIAGVSTRRGGRSWLTALVASVIALVLGWYELQSVNDVINDTGDAVLAQVGIGIWLILAGGVVAAVAAFVTGLRAGKLP